MATNEHIEAAATPDGGAPGQPLAIATQAMVHATALAMANATHAQGCAQQISSAVAGAVVALIMRAGVAPVANTSP